MDPKDQQQTADASSDTTKSAQEGYTLDTQTGTDPNALDAQTGAASADATNAEASESKIEQLEAKLKYFEEEALAAMKQRLEALEEVVTTGAHSAVEHVPGLQKLLNLLHRHGIRDNEELDQIELENATAPEGADKPQEYPQPAV